MEPEHNDVPNNTTYPLGEPTDPKIFSFASSVLQTGGWNGPHQLADDTLEISPASDSPLSTDNTVGEEEESESSANSSGHQTHTSPSGSPDGSGSRTPLLEARLRESFEDNLGPDHPQWGDDSTKLSPFYVAKSLETAPTAGTAEHLESPEADRRGFIARTFGSFTALQLTTKEGSTHDTAFVDGLPVQQQTVLSEDHPSGESFDQDSVAESPDFPENPQGDRRESKTSVPEQPHQKSGGFLNTLKSVTRTVLHAPLKMYQFSRTKEARHAADAGVLVFFALLFPFFGAPLSMAVSWGGVQLFVLSSFSAVALSLGQFAKTKSLSKFVFGMLDDFFFDPAGELAPKYQMTLTEDFFDSSISTILTTLSFAVGTLTLNPLLGVSVFSIFHFLLNLGADGHNQVSIPLRVANTILGVGTCVTKLFEHTKLWHYVVPAPLIRRMYQRGAVGLTQETLRDTQRLVLWILRLYAIYRVVKTVASSFIRSNVGGKALSYLFRGLDLAVYPFYGQKFFEPKLQDIRSFDLTDSEREKLDELSRAQVSGSLEDLESTALGGEIAAITLITSAFVSNPIFASCAASVAVTFLALLAKLDLGNNKTRQVLTFVLFALVVVWYRYTMNSPSGSVPTNKRPQTIVPRDVRPHVNQGVINKVSFLEGPVLTDPKSDNPAVVSQMEGYAEHFKSKNTLLETEEAASKRGAKKFAQLVETIITAHKGKLPHDFVKRLIELRQIPVVKFENDPRLFVLPLPDLIVTDTETFEVYSSPSEDENVHWYERELARERQREEDERIADSYFQGDDYVDPSDVRKFRYGKGASLEYYESYSKFPIVHLSFRPLRSIQQNANISKGSQALAKFWSKLLDSVAPSWKAPETLEAAFGTGFSVDPAKVERIKQSTLGLFGVSPKDGLTFLCAATCVQIRQKNGSPVDDKSVFVSVKHALQTHEFSTHFLKSPFDDKETLPAFILRDTAGNRYYLSAISYVQDRDLAILQVHPSSRKALNRTVNHFCLPTVVRPRNPIKDAIPTDSFNCIVGFYDYQSTRLNVGHAIKFDRKGPFLVEAKYDTAGPGSCGSPVLDKDFSVYSLHRSAKHAKSTHTSVLIDPNAVAIVEALHALTEYNPKKTVAQQRLNV